MMPRFSIQANEGQFRALWALLDRADETTASTQELIRMLETSEKLYQEVIGMKKVTSAEGEVDWPLFFQGSNEYEKIYMQEIILSVLEDSEESNDKGTTRVMFVEE